MQLSLMRDEARKIFNEPDSTNSHISETELNAWANEFYRVAQTRLAAIPIKNREYTSAAAVDGVSSITLNSRFMGFQQVYLKAQPENKYRPLEIIDLDTLNAIDPEWRSAAEGVPEYIIRTDTFTAILYPPPNTENQGQSIQTYGREFMSDLSGDTDAPTLPLCVHDLFPHFMAYRSFQKLQQMDLATNELIYVNSQLKSQQQSVTQFSTQRSRWLFHGAE